MVNLLIYYIKSIYVARDYNYHKKTNLALSHLIAYLLEVKYNISFGSPPDYVLSPMMNKSFHIFYVTRSHSPHKTKGPEE